MKTIKQAFDSGAEEFAKHCLLYGTIVYDESYLDAKQRPCRHYVIKLDNTECTIVKRLGEVIEASYTAPGSNSHATDYRS
jgi:hypothetical protein